MNLTPFISWIKPARLATRANRDNVARPQAVRQRKNMEIKKEDNKVVPPVDNSSTKETPDKVTPPVEVKKDSTEDADFEKTLSELENGQDVTPLAKPARTELEKAMFAAKSTLNRIKELGGDTSELLDEPAKGTPKEIPALDTSKFATKDDLLRIEARKVAKSDAELKVIMWYVTNKGMSIEDAHLLANKRKLKSTFSEINRIQTTVPSNGGGAGERAEDITKAPELPIDEKRRLTASGMIYDEKKKAYVGKKVQYRHDGKQWVTEKIS